ncbi:MAG: hypothetical protein JWO15_3681 [Sphingomonadales bacterium]|nr:hypothetical protein [Sphingomonadales bacterium]
MSQKPELSNVEPAVRDASARGMSQMSTFVQDLYYLALIDLSIPNLKQVLKNELPLSIGPSSAVRDNKSPEYAFRLPPKVHEMGEPFATSITMTQNGGKYVESQGSPLKDLRISGTTGLRPHRNDSKTLKVFGVDTGTSGPLAQTISLAGLGTTPNLIGTVSSVFKSPSPWEKNEAIGHDDIIFLRNMFRLYAWHKENNPSAGKIVMLWRNIKDADYWIVEPQEFHLNQNSSSPLTYEYSITFKTLARWDHKIKVNLSKDPLQFSKDGRTFLARVNQSTAVIRNSFLTVANQIDRLARVPFNATNFVLGPMAAVLEGATAVRRSEKRFTDLFRSSLISCRDSIQTYLVQASKFLPGHDILIHELRKAKRAAERLIADPELQPDSQSKAAYDDKQKILDSYVSSQPNNTPGASGSSSYIGNQSLGQSLGQAQVNPGDTIRSLAGRLLGDKTKYHTLVIINSLQYPFIGPTKGPGVLTPGDTILFPQESTSDSNNFGVISSTKKSTQETNTVDDQLSNSSMAQAYGRDLRLTITSTGVTGDKMDIKPNQNGDSSTVMGIPNVAQAVKLKFSVTRGELPLHPFFGASFPIGSKATPTTMAGFRIDVEQTLASDPRIVDIRSLRFVTVGDTLSVNASIALASSDSAVRLTFPLRKLDA